jgi:hypothetical protein
MKRRASCFSSAFASALVNAEARAARGARPPWLDPLRRLVALLACALLAACTTPFGIPCADTRPSEQTDFPGIAQLTASAPNRTLDVLMVHGMCTHLPDWAEGALNRLQSALGGEGKLEIKEVRIPSTKVKLYRAKISFSAGTVNANALLWSPVVATLKRQLCYDESKKSASCQNAPDYPHERAIFNSKLKDVLLDDCLADAMIYQGISRDAISEQMQKAIMTAAAGEGGDNDVAALARDAATQTTPMVFVTESLGSKIAFDAIFKLIRNEKGDKTLSAAGRRTFDRTIQIFMGANQIPVLALADQPLEGAQSSLLADSRYPPDPLAALIELKTKPLAIGAPVPRVIAFTDPNDLLSYVLVPADQHVVPYPVVDVIVSNSDTYLGSLELPDKAHLDYRTNPAVVEIIANGNSDRRCPKR